MVLDTGTMLAIIIALAGSCFVMVVVALTCTTSYDTSVLAIWRFLFSLSHFVSPSDLPEQVEQYTHHNLYANRGERVVKLFFCPLRLIVVATPLR